MQTPDEVLGLIRTLRETLKMSNCEVNELRKENEALRNQINVLQSKEVSLKKSAGETKDLRKETERSQINQLIQEGLAIQEGMDHREHLSSSTTTPQKPLPPTDTIPKSADNANNIASPTSLSELRRKLQEAKDVRERVTTKVLRRKESPL